MKNFFRRSGLLVILGLSGLAVHAQTDKRVADIRGKVAEINKGAGKFTKTKKDVTGISTEGAEATLFHKGKELKKVVAKIYGETFNAISEFYFDGGDLIFAYDKINHYDTQIGLEKPVKVVRVEEIRSYFDGGKMFKLLNGAKTTAPGTDDFVQKEKENQQIVKGILEPE
jgi:hypothetical protein